MVIISDGSESRPSLGSAKDQPYLQDSGSNFREGPRPEISSGSISRPGGHNGGGAGHSLGTGGKEITSFLKSLFFWFKLKSKK